MTQKKRRIVCTPDNLPQMRALVHRWPELSALVTSLQEQNLFPGLRNLQIELTGPPDYLAQGLDAPLPPSPASGPKNPGEPPCN